MLLIFGGLPAVGKTAIAAGQKIEVSVAALRERLEGHE